MRHRASLIHGSCSPREKHPVLIQIRWARVAGPPIARKKSVGFLTQLSRNLARNAGSATHIVLNCCHSACHLDTRPGGTITTTGCIPLVATSTDEMTAIAT